jgi:hypothetical protein
LAAAPCSNQRCSGSYAGPHCGACQQFSRWTYAGGKQLPGLVKRRAEEKQLCGWCVMSAEARASIIVFLILLVAGLGLFFGSAMRATAAALIPLMPMS